uniref:Uncharacterized protein n=1 Tax=Glossina palpalis gambiensis TaxID=67801 RepID=A0A1B0BMV8_9MUSC
MYGYRQIHTHLSISKQLITIPSAVIVLMITVSPIKMSRSETDMKASLIISMARSSLISHGISNCRLVKPIRLSNICWILAQDAPAAFVTHLKQNSLPADFIIPKNFNSALFATEVARFRFYSHRHWVEIY